MHFPDVAEHPDSGKVLTLTWPDPSGVQAFRRTDAVPPMLDEPDG